MKRPEKIIDASTAAFRTTESRPRMTLRGGDAVDGYREPPDFDPALDEPTDDYLERYHWGVTYLDPESWRFYLPTLFDYALRNCSEGSSGSSLVIDALLSSLRPPEKDPPRFSVLTPNQEEVIVDRLPRIFGRIRFQRRCDAGLGGILDAEFTIPTEDRTRRGRQHGPSRRGLTIREILRASALVISTVGPRAYASR